MPTILAITVQYKNQQNITSLEAQLRKQSAKVVFWVKDNTEDNILYTAAVNQGIKKALACGYDYVLLLGDDIEFTSTDVIKKLVKYMSENKECGIASALHVDRKDNVTFGGGANAFPMGHHITEPLTHELYKKPYKIHWANTSCALIRCNAIIECGLLDENMKFICSDSDYSFTVRSRGWSVDMVPDAKIIHEPNAGFKAEFNSLDKCKYEDVNYFAAKWITGMLYKTISYEGATLTRESIQSHLAEVQGILEAHRKAQTPDIMTSDKASQPLLMG